MIRQAPILWQNMTQNYRLHVYGLSVAFSNFASDSGEANKGGQYAIIAVQSRCYVILKLRQYRYAPCIIIHKSRVLIKIGIRSKLYETVG